MRRLYLWTRDLHLYIGLFLSPFLVLYAVTTLFINHHWLPDPTEPRRDEPQSVTLPMLEDNMAWGRAMMTQLGLTGEIQTVNRQPKNHRAVIGSVKPGERTIVTVDTEAKTAVVERHTLGLRRALVYLHRMPGPHTVKNYGNWVYMRMWAWTADAVIYAALFLTVSGIYMWAVLKAERKAGLISIGAGVVSFVVLTLALLF